MHGQNWTWINSRQKGFQTPDIQPTWTKMKFFWFRVLHSFSSRILGNGRDLTRWPWAMVQFDTKQKRHQFAWRKPAISDHGNRWIGRTVQIRAYNNLYLWDISRLIRVKLWNIVEVVLGTVKDHNYQWLIVPEHENYRERTTLRL